ncbi:MAG: hypothetical protein J3R72DRAFT_516787 [Linnemannia gamsii]|nr:MAG: hypothetical protein J3R72DRAFT_516787 [Linnemannia gamsii]
MSGTASSYHHSGKESTTQQRPRSTFLKKSARDTHLFVPQHLHLRAREVWRKRSPVDVHASSSSSASVACVDESGSRCSGGGLLGAGPVAAGGLFGAPAVAVGGFGAAPVAGGLGGFGGGMAIGQPAQPAPPHLTIELSEPKFPDFITAADIIKTIESVHYTDESKKAVAEYEWTNTQHLWHLVRTNPGFTQFDTYKRGMVGLHHISADYACSTLRALKSLKVLDGRSRFDWANCKFWTLLECHPEGIESL